MICKDCLYQRNCINGSWCIERKIYVELKVINQWRKCYLMDMFKVKQILNVL